MDINRIIYVSHWCYPSLKASPRIAMRTCQELAGRGFEVELWVPWRRNPKFRGVDPFSYHHIKRNFIIRRLPALDLIGILSPKFGLFVLLASFNVSVALYAMLRGILKKTIFYSLELRDVVLLSLFHPHIFFEAHDFYQTPIYKLNRWFFLRTRGIIPTNHRKLEYFKEEFGIPSEKLLHKPCPVETSLFNIQTSREEARKILKIPSSGTIILYCGQVILWKGVDTLLEVNTFLKPNESIYFIVGGSEEDINTFKNKCREIDARNVVVIEGQPHENIPLWLRAADVLILPNTGRDYTSKYDTSPLKLFEYMASGRPIVASDLPSIRNIVNEDMVWFFEPDNPESMAKTINIAISDTQSYNKKCAIAQKEAEKYSWERRFTDIIRFIDTRLNIAVGKQ